MDRADFQAAGLYDPSAANAAERLELLEWLAARGVSIERMVRAARENLLVALAGDLVLDSGPRYTLAEVMARTGLPRQIIEELTLAIGLPVGDEERPFTDESVHMFGFFKDGAALFGEGPLLRFLRTIGSSLARMSESAVSLFYVNVEGPMRRRGTRERELAQAGLRAIESIGGLQVMIQGLFRLHMDTTIRRFRGLELGRQIDTAHMTVGFVDLVGFTPLASRLPPGELAALVERFEVTAHDVVTSRGGRVVKLIGDEVMFVTVDAAAGCDAALALIERFAGDATVTPRGALATGDLVLRGGDYYGPIVNLASRLAELAVPSELLVTRDLATEAGSPAFRFEPAGKRMLKGFDEPVALLTVERASSRAANR
jgi:class 3 adenylate cyclase